MPSITMGTARYCCAVGSKPGEARNVALPNSLSDTVCTSSLDSGVNLTDRDTNKQVRAAMSAYIPHWDEEDDAVNGTATVDNPNPDSADPLRLSMSTKSMVPRYSPRATPRG